MQFSVTILGSNSALPTSHRNPTAQLLNVAERFFLIDCGEGTQLQLRRNKIKFTKINHIFISHLHGDHCFGLIGLISTLGLLKRQVPLCIYAHSDLKDLLQPHLIYFCADLPFEVKFIAIDPAIKHEIYCDDKIRVSTIPLNHRVPTCGFLFEEMCDARKINPVEIKRHSVSLKDIVLIRAGDDWIAPNGDVVPNSQLTVPGNNSRSYAFCSDTQYCPNLKDYFSNTSLLYHEATFLHELLDLAQRSSHSTALQAGQVALDLNSKYLAIGHFSSRYRDTSLLLAESCSIFPNTFEAKEGRTFFIHNNPEISISVEDLF